MSLFLRLKQDAADEWNHYIHHQFVLELGKGTLKHECFQNYLKQDYLFLKHFARAYALAVYKSQELADMRSNLKGLSAILEKEMELHVRLCESWGIERYELENEPEANQNIAYTRFVLEQGMRGDLLDLKVALSPCVIGYAEIGKYLKSQPNRPAVNDYNIWIYEYGSEDYQELAASAAHELDSLGERFMTEPRYLSLLEIFRQATLLEADFWQMALDRSDG